MPRPFMTSLTRLDSPPHRWIGWRSTGQKPITWQFPELPDPNGVIERELIADGTVTAEQLRTFEDSSQAWQDEIWTAAAEQILEKHNPNLLLFHLLTLDDTNHEYGPMSPASFTAMAFLDAKVKQILDVLQRTGLSRNATLIVVSDHGFRNFKHKVHPNVLLRKKGLLSEGPGQPKGDAWVLSEGGTAAVYVTNPDRRASVVAELRDILTGAEGIDHVYGVEDFPKLGYPLPTVTAQAPDLVLAAVPDYVFSNGSDENLLRKWRQVARTAISIQIQKCRPFSSLGARVSPREFASTAFPIWMLPLPSLRCSGFR